MRSGLAIVALAMLLGLTKAQAQQDVLQVPVNGIFEMSSDTLRVGNLILNDSATLILNKKSASSVIIAQSIEIGSGCKILGNGMPGEMGKKGRSASQPTGACKDGNPGEDGKNGTNGMDGASLSLVIDELNIRTLFEINLSGGNGGDGGNGGAGSHGARGTRQCTSNGGKGGNGGDGGNGGNGGTLKVVCHNCPAVEDLMSLISLNNKGGYLGYGGDYGSGGLPGEGASAQNSKKGANGKMGAKGKKGADGNPLFQTLSAMSGQARVD